MTEQRKRYLTRFKFKKLGIGDSFSRGKNKKFLPQSTNTLIAIQNKIIHVDETGRKYRKKFRQEIQENGEIFVIRGKNIYVSDEEY